jgi:hypothetical protein
VFLWRKRQGTFTPEKTILISNISNVGTIAALSSMTIAWKAAGLI